jgi:predicted neuraminidase
MRVSGALVQAACIVIGSTARTGAAPPTPVAHEFIFMSAPFAASHASTIVALRDGTLLAAWFGGSAEGARDVAIWSARRAAGRWSAPRVLAREPGVATWNPVLFRTHDRRLWLYYKFGPNVESWTAARRYSDDDGHTWSRAEHLPAGLYGPIRTKPLVLADGTVVSGTSVESYTSWAAWIERSTDDGRTFARIGPIEVPVRFDRPNANEPRFGIIQPAVVALSPAHLRFYARPTVRVGRVCVSDSFDAGRHWSDAHPIDIPNPNAAVDALVLRDGRTVLVYDDSRTARTPLVAAVSADGIHFVPFATLESGPGEYSYPALIQDRAGDLDFTYTWRRRRIRYARIRLTDIPAQRGAGEVSSEHGSRAATAVREEHADPRPAQRMATSAGSS